MSKEQEMREHLEAGVLNTTPGTKENQLAVDALTAFNNTYCDVMLKQEEFRLKEEKQKKDIQFKQDEIDNQILKDRDEQDFKAEQSRKQGIREWIDTAIKGVGLVVNTILCVVIIRKDADGKPILSGPGRQVVSNLFRKH